MTSLFKVLFVSSSLIFFSVLVSRNQAKAKNWFSSSFGEASSRIGNQQHLRKLQSSGFSLRRKFCIPDGKGSFETKHVFFFRSFLFRRRYEQTNEGPCGEDKCSELCEYIPCMISYSFSEDTESCICNVDSTPVECGVNAECSETADACVCKEGYTGDSITGCVAETPVPTTKSVNIATTMPATAKPTTIGPTPPPTSNAKCTPACRTGKKCCDGICIQHDACCPNIDGVRCPDGTCANDPPNFGCCSENQCGNTCCTEGLICCEGECKDEDCCGDPDPCCGDPDPCCGSECSDTGNTSGEPHLTTYDGLAYDCQAEGEFILTKSLNSWFEIQVRFKRIAQLSASIMKGISIQSSKRTSKVQIIVSEDDNLTIRLWVNGNEIQNLEEGFESKSFQFGRRSMNEYFFYNSDASMNITVIESPEGAFLNLNLNIVQRLRKETFVGLLGTPDNDPTNDWMNKAGEEIPIPNTREDLVSTQANEYCARNWCLRDKNKTLFVYDDANEFETLSQGCDRSYAGRPEITDPEILYLCGEDFDCLLDGFLFGVETARSSVAAQTQYLESINRFRVSPTNLMEGVDTMINVTLDLRNNITSFDTKNVEHFAIYAIDDSTSETVPDRIGTLSRMGTEPIFLGENIEISGLGLKSGMIPGLSARVANSTTNEVDADRTISGRTAFRVLNRFGEGKCFQTKEELQFAVQEYLVDSSRSSAVARKYGWPIGIWCLKNIKNFNELFTNSINFAESLHHWDVSQATSMASMFKGAKKFNSDISQWDVENVFTMESMFEGASSFNNDISGWSVRNVQSMERMFQSATSFNIDLSNWELQSVTSTRDMFAFANAYKQNLCSWGPQLKGRNEVDTRDMFIHTANCPSQESPDFSLPDPSPFCYSCSTAASNTFSPTSPSTKQASTTVNRTISPSSTLSPTIAPPTKKPSFLPSSETQTTNASSSTFSPTAKHYAPLSDGIYLGWAVDDYLGNDTYASSMYGPVIGEWDVSLVKDFSYLFQARTNFNSRLDKWDVSRATDMSCMFHGAETFNQPLATWDVSKVTDMSLMFLDAKAFNQPLATWNVSKVTDMNTMFCHAEAFSQSLETWDVSSVTDMSNMFDCLNCRISGLSGWNVSNLEVATHMFAGNHFYNEDLSAWDISSVTDLGFMFYFATVFNHSLCAWGPKLNIEAEGYALQEMFSYSGCPTWSDPDRDATPPGPFCYPCN